MKLVSLRILFFFYQIARSLFPNPIAQIDTPSGKELKVEVFNDRLGRSLGLSYRDHLDDDGALFIFERSGVYSFHTYGMQFSIDIVFLDSNYQVVYIAYNQTPMAKDMPRPLITPPRPALYVLELPAMSAEGYGLKLGSQVSIRT
ncbi:MAG: DUF192 domain-containing protein [Chlamydiae bacterium]|nr:DUF192 domain-containing protein [Chlamydiota bacterium]